MEENEYNFKLTYAVGAIDESHVALFDELYKILGNKFKVIIEASPKSIGTGKTPYIRNEYQINFNTNNDEAWKVLKNSDVLVIGNTNKYVRKFAMKARKKLVYIEGERIRKKKFTFKEEIRHRIGMFFHHKIYQRKNLFYLCIGAYVEQDLKEFGLYKGRCIPWGYWPSFGIEKPKEKVWDGKNIKLIYIGQMIPIKRPEMCFDIAKEFENAGYNVQLDFLGSGILLDKIKEMANSNMIKGKVNVHGRVPLEQVKEMLQEAHFYLSTSDYRDGWNMVINQALECGTPVISQEEVGSAKVLIKDGENGILFESQFKINNKIIVKLISQNFRLSSSPRQKVFFLIGHIKNYLIFWSKK